MAEKNIKEAAAPEMVEVNLDINEKTGPDATVILNGKTYKIQRGVPVMVPVGVKEVLDNQKAMDTLAFQRKQALVEKAAKKKL